MTVRTVFGAIVLAMALVIGAWGSLCVPIPFKQQTYFSSPKDRLIVKYNLWGEPLSAQRILREDIPGYHIVTQETGPYPSHTKQGVWKILVHKLDTKTKVGVWSEKTTLFLDGQEKTGGQSEQDGP